MSKHASIYFLVSFCPRFQRRTQESEALKGKSWNGATWARREHLATRASGAWKRRRDEAATHAEEEEGRKRLLEQEQSSEQEGSCDGRSWHHLISVSPVLGLRGRFLDPLFMHSSPVSHEFSLQ